MHFFLSIANASDVEIGLDPTIRPLKNTQRYDIVLRANNGDVRTYRTLKTLASRPPEILFGRATRVWTALRVEDGKEVGEPVVLKDAWVDLDRAQEGSILEKVRAAVRLAEDAQPSEDFFPTVDCHGDVIFNEGTSNTLDHTRCFEESGARIGPSASSREQLLQSLAVSATSSNGQSSDTESRAAKCLVHYRIVFQEVCTTLCDETSLPTIFGALARVTLGKHRSKYQTITLMQAVI